MIPVCRDETSTHQARADFILPLHGEIRFHPGKARQFSTWYLDRFVYIFFFTLFHPVYTG